MTDIIKGKHPYNAECSIDYVNRNTTFNYPQDVSLKNDMTAYGGHFVAQILTFFIFIFIFEPLLINIISPLVQSVLIVSGYNVIISYLGLAFFLVYIIYFVGISWKFVSAFSTLLHLNNEWLRDNYADTNSLHHVFISWIRKKLNKPKINVDLNIPFTKKYIVVGNYIIILKHDIVFEDYELIGDLSKNIKSVFTRCFDNEKKRKSVGTNKFYLFFEFSKKPESGGLIIW